MDTTLGLRANYVPSAEVYRDNGKEDGNYYSIIG